ncbi:MAG: AAA family ATPase, partial [Oscillospiraceae bacterium]|nr:AAA family ATPase [Oscillospiraceae bacterium]
MLDKAAIARLFDQDVEDDTPTLERLGKVRGWEKVYDLINGVLVLLRRQIKQSAVNEAALPPEAPDICVERLAGIRTLRQKRQVPVPNFVLTGNPGTGKTEIGNMIGDILYEEGILPTSKVIMVGKSELTSSLVAGIPAAVIRCADRAEGGVLFIDEAPQIADEDGGVNNEGSGPEVIQTLNRVMTDPTRRLCVVLAGYQQGMEKLFGIDPGFRSRFGGNEVNIDDYEPDLLCSIFRKRLENMNGLSFTPAPSLYDPSRTDGEKQPLDHYMEHLYLKRDRRTFGNARSMVTLARNVAGRALSENRQEIRQEDFYGIAPFSETSTESEPDVVDDTWFAPVNPTDSMDELERYIRENTVGLEFLIERFRLIYERVMECRAQGLPEDKMQLRSFVLIGNPGSGKDLVANLLGRLFRILNVLNCPEIITHDGGDLASSYLGGSIERAKEWIEEAQSRNALLFINEAHQLTNERFDGKGALRAFIAPMTNNKQFVSAFAVYPGECEAFYKLDDGLRSRLEEIRLPDYTDKQLYEIFLRMCKKKGVLVDHPDMSATLALVSRICVRLYRDFQPNNGNARQMQVLLQEMDDLRVARCRRCNIPFDSENRRVFLPEDIPPVWLRKLPDRGCNDPDDRDDFGEIERILRQEVVGRENLVDEFRKLSDEAMEARVQKRDNFWPKPIILEGYPGSGKTLIGRLLARLYNILGVVRCDEPITFDASALSSCYQNGVRRAAEDIIEEARRRGAVVFVDEAHQLLDQTDGRGALQAFISPMNDPDISRRVLVVFAVYHDRLEEFKASDQGLQRRVNILSLTDYTGPELKQILLHMARNNGNTITPELETQLDAICDRLYENRTASSGNAGLMENFLHDMNDLRRQRCRLRAIPYDAPNYMELCPEDVP